MTPGVQPLIAGNWKMHGTLAEAKALAGAVAAGAGAGAGLLVAPPFPFLPAVAAALAGSPVALGAQDCHAAPKGAHTGDVAAAMLREVGATHVILGHSERRADHGETDAVVQAKAAAAMAAGLIPIVCVGESEAQRLAGEAEAVVRGQLAGSLPPAFAAAGGIIAYEPVWAIGTGKVATPQQAQEVHALIRALLGSLASAAVAGKIRIQYGGSVKPDNAADLAAQPDIDGALVGGASLKADDFLGIAKAFG